MRLEKIILNGFKSFADKTEFRFDSAITAIVGPNGCGKSNVVDAVKWVLGEQSAKQLRSGQMADVIFSGSSSRKPMSCAEVTLVVSNNDRKLSIDTDQVEISRRILASGDSEYRINGRVCRLKDIRELFMDTGVGVRAYSIIEQGQIEQLLNATKTDRRAVFEEAAGISKYKAHKKEALRKLERTEQNLLRLADILSEVTRSLRSIKLQAGKARSYLQYSQRLKELQVKYALSEYSKNLQAQRRESERLAGLQEQFGAVAAEVGRDDSRLSELGRQIIDTESQLNRAGSNLVAVRSKIEQHTQQIEFLRTRIGELQQRRDAAAARIEQLRRQRVEFSEQLAQLQASQRQIRDVRRQKQQAAEEISKAIEQLSADCAALEAELEDEKSGIIDIVRRTAQLHNELQSISVQRGNLASQKQRLADQVRSSHCELEKLLTEKARQQARLGDIEKVLADLQESLEAKRKQRQQLEKKTSEAAAKLAGTRETHSALNSERSVLAEMEAKRQGLSNAVKTILKERSVEQGRFDYVEALLADVVSADVEYASAVEAALQGRAEALIVNSTARLAAEKEFIKSLEGRVSFICMDSVKPFVDTTDFAEVEGVRGRVAQFVRTPSRFAALVWALLGKTVIVESVDVALELSKRFNGEYTFVTPSGELVGGGCIKLGPLGRTAGLISRKSRLRQLEQTIDRVQGEIRDLESQIERDSRDNEHLGRLCKELRTSIYEANTEKMQVESKLAVLEGEISRLREQEPLLAGEIEMLQEQIAQAVQKEYDSKQRLEELEQVNAERTERIKKLDQQYAQQKARHQQQSVRLTELRVELGQLGEQEKAGEQAIEGLAARLQENHNAVSSAGQELKSLAEQMSRSQRQILHLEAEVSQLYVEKEKSQQCSRELQRRVAELVAEKEDTEQRLRSQRGRQGELEQQINEVKVVLGQLEVKNQDLVERVREELGLELAEAYEHYEESDVDWEQVRAEIAELRGKIERLGNVNVDAISEQESLEQRHEFLTRQLEDLNESKAQLQQLINRLNRDSRDKFRYTFEQIRTNFQELFRKLFGGGKADIVLEEADDILEAPIEIIARPPGKETRSISLLSGGEKSMTAIALLFAIFKTKPSPFCFLDEIDAPLDEANNERFNMILQDFVQDSQFIIITHSKRTMSIADELFGITMQTRGVSKKISVAFNRFEQQQEAAAVA